MLFPALLLLQGKPALLVGLPLSAAELATPDFHLLPPGGERLLGSGAHARVLHLLPSTAQAARLSPSMRWNTPTQKGYSKQMVSWILLINLPS